MGDINLHIFSQYFFAPFFLYIFYVDRSKSLYYLCLRLTTNDSSKLINWLYTKFIQWFRLTDIEKKRNKKYK